MAQMKVVGMAGKKVSMKVYKKVLRKVERLDN